MLKKITAFFAAAFLAAGALAQQAEVSSIVPSSSPAFTVLGISPTEISKPNSWNALQAAVYQNLVSSGSAAPKNFSLEFSPYWLSNHPNFTVENYLDQSGFSLRNLSLSVASAKAPFGKDSVQSLGFGFRLPIMTRSKNRDKIKQNLTQYLTNIRTNTTTFQADFMAFVFSYNGSTVGDFLTTIAQNTATPPASPTFWSQQKNLVTTLMSDTLTSALSPVKTELFTSQQLSIANIVGDYFANHNQPIAADATQQISTAIKDVSAWEISGALALAFPTNQFDYSQFSKISVWTDYSFKFSKTSSFEGTAALRYVKSFGTDSIGASDNFDAIYRLNYSADKQQKFTISAWGLLRHQSNHLPGIVLNNITYKAASHTWDNKYGIDISYKVSDNLAVAYSFGKNYKNDFTLKAQNSNQLISFLNLFYSLNTKVVKGAADSYSFKTL